MVIYKASRCKADIDCPTWRYSECTCEAQAASTPRPGHVKLKLTGKAA